MQCPAHSKCSTNITCCHYGVGLSRGEQGGGQLSAGQVHRLEAPGGKAKAGFTTNGQCPVQYKHGTQHLFAE